MIFIPFGILLLIGFIVFTGVFFTLWIFGAIPFALSKVGISPWMAMLIYILTFVGSFVNIPLARQENYSIKRSFWYSIPMVQQTTVAINLGGAIIPVIVSIYLLAQIGIGNCILPILIMVIISKALTRVVPGRGFVMPAFIPPIVAVLLAYIFYPEQPAACAYVTGTLGVLIGADLLNLDKIKKLESTFVSIGGAGVFDGIFLTGVISALLS
ncbi:MAG TPA: DUF1614 domain-containing protein [Candidatus Hydrothermia bacterium]|nr:DUF1614 domain-containing protein [Candidatus Hydrothermae bacterium]MDD3649641.1 DUF1614 domain-containing protein [Candidatus Hydrothermia bacterium]MDD5573505.1 DUF1614 domain-containing protein [Candidatus Hydrothermia bacterium]HOK23551.1 DUF1614 domain-containing protein [Candidatus Hydrothermia bacterium]HOL24220.1 DUF1614 domain-containing protein [Candidatus Hydrothermia bacterium]